MARAMWSVCVYGGSMDSRHNVLNWWLWCILGNFKNMHELLNQRSLKIAMLYKNHIIQCMGKIFYVEFQRVHLKLHTKFLSHTVKGVDLIQRWKLRSLISVFERPDSSAANPVPVQNGLTVNDILFQLAIGRWRLLLMAFLALAQSC